MAESEQSARHEAQGIFFADLKRQRIFTLIHALAICAVAGYAIYKNYPITGGALMALAVVGGWLGSRKPGRAKNDKSN